jgi:hypothetical protein
VNVCQYDAHAMGKAGKLIQEARGESHRQSFWRMGVGVLVSFAS